MRFAVLLGSLVCVAGSRSIQAQIQDPSYFEYQLRHGKDQSLKWSCVPPGLRFFGEVRGRTEGRTSYDLREGNDRTYELTRLRIGAEFDFARLFTLAVAAQDTHALGLPLPAVEPTMRDQLDLFTGNIAFHPRKTVQVIAGRQPLAFGSEHLVGISDWANNSRSYDGFTGRFGERKTLELFSVSVVKQNPTSLDKHGGGLTFHGAVFSFPATTKHVEVQSFLYVLALPQTQSPSPAPGSVLEATFGAEASGTKSSGFEFDLLGAIQRGSRAQASVTSGAAIARAGYVLRSRPLRPRFVGEFDYASGGSSKDKKHTNTFDQLYASNHGKFGLVDQFGLQNIVQVQGDLDLLPSKHSTLRLQGESLYLANSKDNVYKADGQVLKLAPAEGFHSRQLGAEVDVSGTYLWREYLRFDAGVGHLFPGEVLSEVSALPGTTVGYLQVSYRFKVSR